MEEPAGLTARAARPPAQRITCEYCGSSYVRKHSCRKKAQAQAAGDMGVMRAHALFERWWRRNMRGKKPKTLSQFAASPLFSTFILLERLVSEVYMPSGASYLDWLMDNGIASRDWCKNSTVDRFKKTHSREQDPIALATRSLESVARWCDDAGIDVSSFYSRVPLSDAMLWIQNGRLSPWVLLLSERSGDLFDRMNEDQLERVMASIDLSYWEARFRVSSDESDRIRAMLREMGL
jgi:hypothetical protein